MINFRGVKPVYIPAVWKLHVPPKIHVFLWLVSHNKIMTRDNLRKRHKIKPLDCVFCSENESVHHLFFGCVVAKYVWTVIGEYFNISLGDDYLSIARFWLSNMKNSALNVACAAAMWYLWKIRNSMIFNYTMWSSVHQVIGRIHRMVKMWAILSTEQGGERLESFSTFLATKLKTPLAIGSA